MKDLLAKSLKYASTKFLLGEIHDSVFQDAIEVLVLGIELSYALDPGQFLTVDTVLSLNSSFHANGNVLTAFVDNLGAHPELLAGDVVHARSLPVDCIKVHVPIAGAATEMTRLVVQNHPGRARFYTKLWSIVIEDTAQTSLRALRGTVRVC